MASFSFGAGNAAKIARIPLYAAGRMLTLIVPRSRDRWIIGCGIGIGDGALVMWDECHAHGQKMLWLAGSHEEVTEARQRGMRVVRKHSVRGLWETARAGVIFVTHGFGDVNRYAVSGAYVVQLWHGIPLKRIGVDSEETLRSPFFPRSRMMRGFLRYMYRNATRAISLIPAASHVVRGRLETAFAVADSTVAVVGEPRVDVLSRGNEGSRREDARRELARLTGAEEGSTFLLYAPTWRDGELDPAVPSAQEWQQIHAFLHAHRATLFIRSHPLGAGNYEVAATGDVNGPLETRVRMLGADVARDVTGLLPGIDVLVTDYSSLMYDSALVPLPVVFFAPDLLSYAQRRGFYGTYADVAGGQWAETWTQALGQLQEVLEDPSEIRRRQDHARALSERMHAFRDGRNALRVYEHVKARTSERENPRRLVRTRGKHA